MNSASDGRLRAPQVELIFDTAKKSRNVREANAKPEAVGFFFAAYDVTARAQMSQNFINSRTGETRVLGGQRFLSSTEKKAFASVKRE